MEVKQNTDTHSLLSHCWQALPVNRAGGDMLRGSFKHWEHSDFIPTLLYLQRYISILLLPWSFTVVFFHFYPSLSLFHPLLCLYFFLSFYYPLSYSVYLLFHHFLSSFFHISSLSSPPQWIEGLWVVFIPSRPYMEKGFSCRLKQCWTACTIQPSQ